MLTPLSSANDLVRRLASFPGRRPARAWTVALALAGLGLAACESYLAPPGEGDPEAPVLEDVQLSPASLNVVDAAGPITTTVDARTQSGIEGVSVVLKSPSGNDRLACDMSAPTTGDTFDGRWSCDLTVAQGSESGNWVPDSIGLFSPGADGGVRYFTSGELADAGYEVAVEIISEPARPVSLSVEPESAELPAADSRVTLVATVLDQYGREFPGAQVVWASEDPTIAEVSDSGVVSPVGVGATEIVAALDVLADTALIVVPSTPTTLTVTPDPIALDSVGASVQLAPEVRNQFADPLAGEVVTWTSSNESVVTVTATGLATAVSGGVATIQASAAGLVTDVLVTVDGGPPLPGFTWTNLSGGAWNDPANWDRGAVPGPADTARIVLDGNYTVTASGGTQIAVLEVESASGRPRLQLGVGTFEVADSAWFGPGSTLSIQAGQWAGDGVLVVADSLSFLSGFMLGSGETLVTSTGTLSFPGTDTRTVDARSVRLEGTGLVDEGILSLRNGAQLTVATGAVLDVGASSISSSTPGADVGRLVVEGELRKPASLGDGSISARLVNNGRVVIGAGRLFVTSGEGGFEGGGEWVVDVDATLRTGGTPAVAEIGAGGRVTGTGTWEVRTSTTVLGAVEMDGGIDFGNPGITLDVASADTVRVARLQVGAGGTVQLADGVVVRVNDSFGMGPGPATVAGQGRVLLPGGTEGNVASFFDATLTDGVELEVGGLLTWDQGGFILSNGADIRITSDGTFRLPGSGTLQSQTGALGDPSILVEGRLEGDDGAGPVTIQPDVVNTGTLTLGTAPLALTGAFDHGVGATLEGVGTLDLTAATVDFQGDISPGAPGFVGQLTVDGDLTLGAGSTVSVQVGGTQSGVESDLLSITGSATFAGTLELTQEGGFLPAAGDTIGVVSYGSATGTFAAVTGLDFGVGGGGEELAAAYEDGQLILVGPEVVDPVALSGTIVFVSERDGSRELYVKDLETGVVTQLTDDVFSKSSPRWAPDGSRIAYSTGAIRLINSDGTGATTLGTSSSNSFGPTWSPDGTRIGYQDSSDGDWDILIVDADPPRTITDLTQSVANEFYPDWSPDGTRFAYTTSNSGSVVSVRASDAGDLQTHYSGSARYPAWSPDGTEIAFSEAFGGGTRIAVVTIATGAVRELVNDATTNWYPTWSPDGAYIMYAKTPSFPTNPFDLYAIRSDGSGDQILIEASAENDFYPDWIDGVTLPTGSPTATITSPADGSSFSPGTNVTFTGSATDPEDGALSGASLAWSSSLDGALGTGASISVSTLSAGDHVITLTATDSEANTGSASINVTIAPTADLSVAMTVTPDPVNIGDTLTHTVTVSNAGPDPVNDVELSLLVEGDVLFAFVNEEGCSNLFSNDPPQKLFQCQLGTLAAGADTTLTLRILPQAEETLISTADISSFTGAVDPDAGDRAVAEPTTVNAGAPSGTVNLRGGIGAEGFGGGFGPSYLVGDTVPMFYTVNNLAGPDDEPNPLVTVTVTGVEIEALPTFPAYCDTATLSGPAGFRWTCATRPLGPFTGSEIDTLYFVPRTSGAATLQFDVTGDFTETDPSDNSETETTDIAAPADLTGAMIFSSERDGTRDVYIKDLVTGTITQVENDAGTSSFGELSPDGTRIAYSNFQFGDNQPIYIVNSNGSGNVVEVSTTFIGSYPFWDPNGSVLYFTDQVGSLLNIWGADPLDPTARVNLTNIVSPDQNTYDPQISPDGNFFAYGENNDRIVQVQTNGTNRTVLYDAPNQLGLFRAESPDYSPDGTEVLFTTTTDILAVNVSTLAVRTVLAGDGTDVYLGPIWSPDGQNIIYTRLVGSDYQIWTAPADGSGTQTLVEAGAGFDLVSDWVTGVPGVTN